MKLIVGENDLATTHSELAKEADGWDPTSVVAGTHKKLKWKCSLEHTWEATGKHRLRGQGCPFCANQKVWRGFNDLATTNPELAKEADGWDPTTVISGTAKKMQWKCGQGHKWIATGDKRVFGNNCPVCSNRQVLMGFNDLTTTHPELAKQAHGWDSKTVVAGSNKKLGWKCEKGHIWKATVSDRTNDRNCPVCSNRQVLMGFNDLATTHPELAKEADGWNPTTVVAGTHKKLQWKCLRGHTWNSKASERNQGYNCPYCANQKVWRGFNDLATTNPELAKEADGWDPTTIIAGTHKKLQWKCFRGHTWKAACSSRSRNGCPVCGNKEVLIGFNDIFTTHPELAKQMVVKKNYNYTKGSDKKVEWKCENNHKWFASISHRVQGQNCPSCSISGFDPNKKGYLYFLIQPVWEIFQIGITNVPEDRLSRHKRNSFELLELRGPMDGHTAQELETAILRFLKSQKADLSPEHIAGKFDGYSESWTIDSYKVNNLKELIDKASEAGF
jgi:hypothetical protein